MAREFHVDIDLKGVLQLDGSAGSLGQVPVSQGPGQKPVWGNVQAYDADLAAIAALATTGLVNRTGDGTAQTVAMPAGSLVGTTATQSLTNKTYNSPVFGGSITEGIFTIVDAVSFEINPANGTIQLLVLGASRTPKATSFQAGQSVTLMVDDGTARTLTWTDTTFGTTGLRWVGGTAPTLATTGYTIIQLWKVGTQVYGVSIGSVA